MIDSGVIGEIRSITANLGYRIDMNERIVRPELAGGALLDLTVYPLNFISMILGDGFESINVSRQATGRFDQRTVQVKKRDIRNRFLRADDVASVAVYSCRSLIRIRCL